MTEKQTGGKPFVVGDGTPGPGRKKGVPNKQTTLIKDMIIAALDKSGGADYLARQAEENPGPFMALVGKVLPVQLAGHDGGALAISVVGWNVKDPAN